MEYVDIDEYFEEHNHDESFIKFLRLDCIGQDVIYTTNNPKYEELYQVTMAIKKQFSDYNKVKKKRTKAKQIDHFSGLFNACENQLRILTRLVEREPKSTWLLYPLFISAKQLIDIAFKLKDGYELGEYVEKCGRSVHRCFTLCLNDRNPNLKENRKTGVYMFANLEFKIYHKLNNRDMIKNLVKVIKTRETDTMEPIPPLQYSLSRKYNASIVTYNYYLGEYYCCYENDFVTATKHLLQAWSNCPSKYCSQRTSIFILLLPCMIISRHALPDLKILDDIPVYSILVQHLRSGNIVAFDKTITENEVWLLSHGVYVAVLQLRNLVFLRLIRRAVLWSGIQSSIISLVPLQIALNVTRTEKIDFDETECILANLISNGYIKGYISHGNQCVVLSKKDPFPIT